MATGPRPALGVTGDVEVDAYGGRTTGGWACGPLGQARYGGLAVDARASERATRDREGAGWTGLAGIAGDVETTRILDVRCEEGSDCDPDRSIAPPTALRGAAHARGGYQGRHWGVEGGAVVAPRLETNHDERTKAFVWPDLAVELHDAKLGRVALGTGVAAAPAIRRPALWYLAGAMPLDDDVDLEASLGANFRGPGNCAVGGRADGALRVRVGPRTRLRAGASLTLPDRDLPYTDFEASAGVVTSF